MRIEDIHRRDRPFGGAKGLIYLGEQLLIATVRDDSTTSYPGYLDLVGGGREPRPNGTWETPFETFSREAWEEIGVELRPRNITYARWYSCQTDPCYTGVMLVAQLPSSAARQLRLGDEGKSIEQFASLASLLDRADFIPVLRARTEDYAQFIGVSVAPARLPAQAA
jgi:8-oxo-dGTP diphosphatase